jgi:hypothetical protein
MSADARLFPMRVLPATQNGELLSLAEMSFDIFITLDKGFAYRQNLTGRRISTLVIRARSNSLLDLPPHVPAMLNAITTAKTEGIIEIG